MRSAPGRRVLVLNAGSSSLKFAVFEGLARRWHGQVEGLGTRPRFLLAGGDRIGEPARDLPVGTQHEAALASILAALDERQCAVSSLAACGHRIVHGGERYVAPMRVEATQLEALQALRELAPLHNRYGLDAIEALRARAPALPQIACFDTAFHASVPEVGSAYALPLQLREAGYRRFGFHGLNFEHVTAEAAARSGGAAPSRLLIFHLGNGCSVCAVRDGRSVGTTMGYSTLDGLIMGTRSGAIDPGLLIALQRDRGLSLDALEELLYRRSGLLALSGRSSDLRELLRIGDPACLQAIEQFCYWAARHAGSLTVALGGVAAIAFSGGIGAGSPVVREQIIGHLGWLGFELDPGRNERGDPSVSAADSRGPIWVVEANEELMIARHVHAVLGDAR